MTVKDNYGRSECKITATINSIYLTQWQVMSMLDPKTIKMFHFTGKKHTTPNCPVEMKPNFNPGSGAQSYRRSTFDCSRTAKYNIPFFVSRPGPKYEEWSVNAHEARPGHHTQVNLPKIEKGITNGKAKSFYESGPLEQGIISGFCSVKRMRVIDYPWTEQ